MSIKKNLKKELLKRVRAVKKYSQKSDFFATHFH
jgi:hypothetical protein